MRLTRKQRIAVELLGPPPLGWLFTYALLSFHTHWLNIRAGHFPVWDSQELIVVGFGFLAAYFIAGLPSIFYMAVMEWRFARGLNPRSWQSVGLSSLLGFLAGFAMAAGPARFQGNVAALAAWGSVGLSVGFLLGIFIRKTADRSTNHAPSNK